MQERLDRISYEDQVKLYDQSQRDLVSVASDRQDAYRLQIANDPLTVDRQQVLDDAILDDGQKATLINSLNSALKDGEKERKAIDWANSGAAANPLDPDDRKSAELVYQQAMRTEQDPDRVASAIVAGKGVVPKPYVDFVRNGLRGTDPLQVGAAYERAAALYSMNPQAVRGADNGAELEDAATKWRLYTEGLGLDAMQAGQRLAELNSPEALKQREALLESQPVKDHLKKLDASRVEGFFDEGLFSIGPDLGASEEGRALAVAEFRQLFKESLGEVGGDLDAAEKLAFQRMSRNWGTSEYSPHGSGVVLKYPVEKLYPPVGESGHEYIGDQAKAALAEEGIEAERFYLVGNEFTVADIRAQREPRLTLQYVDKDGLLQQVPFAFKADVSEAQAKDNARKEAERQAAFDEREATKQYRLNEPSRYERKHGIKREK